MNSTNNWRVQLSNYLAYLSSKHDIILSDADLNEIHAICNRDVVADKNLSITNNAILLIGIKKESITFIEVYPEEKEHISNKKMLSLASDKTLDDYYKLTLKRLLVLVRDKI